MKKSHRNTDIPIWTGSFSEDLCVSRKTVGNLFCDFNKVSVRKNTQIYLVSSGKTSPDQIGLLTELPQPN